MLFNPIQLFSMFVFNWENNKKRFHSILSTSYGRRGDDWVCTYRICMFNNVDSRGCGCGPWMWTVCVVCISLALSFSYYTTGTHTASPTHRSAYFKENAPFWITNNRRIVGYSTHKEYHLVQIHKRHRESTLILERQKTDTQDYN